MTQTTVYTCDICEESKSMDDLAKIEVKYKITDFCLGIFGTSDDFIMAEQVPKDIAENANSEKFIVDSPEVEVIEEANAESDKAAFGE